MIRAVIFGVDDALIADRAAAAAALAVTCAPVESRLGLPAGLLGEAVTAFATARFEVLDEGGRLAAQTGITAEECLWAALGDESARQLPALPHVAAALRRTVFADALAAVSAPPTVAPVDLEVRYGIERRKRTVAVPDAAAVMSSLRDRGLTLIALAEGPVELARERLRLAAAEPWFDLVVFAAEEGLAGTDPALPLLACERAGVIPEQAVYVGARAQRGVAAAARAGLHTVRVVRAGEPHGPAERTVFELAGLLGYVDGWRAGRAFRVVAPSRAFVAADEPEQEPSGRWLCRVGPESDPLRHGAAAASAAAAVQAALRSLRARAGPDPLRHELGEEVDWDAVLR